MDRKNSEQVMSPDERWTDEFLSLERRKQILAEELDQVLHRPVPAARQDQRGDQRPATGKDQGDRPHAR